MAIANDQQMQTFCDTRIRVFAEQIRAAYIAAQDHKAAIDDEYARATSSAAWADNRTDPPHLLQSGNGANPDDMLNFNAFLTNFIAYMAGESAWPVLEKACVRSPGV
jgi:hypothetical protein